MVRVQTVADKPFERALGDNAFPEELFLAFTGKLSQWLSR